MPLADAPQTPNTPLAPSVEKAYYRKCIALKRRLNEVETANDEIKLRRVRLDRAIMKMRLERAFLLDELRKRMDQNIDGSEASADEGLATPPPDRPHRDKRRRQPTGPAGPMTGVLSEGTPAGLHTRSGVPSTAVLAPAATPVQTTNGQITTHGHPYPAEQQHVPAPPGAGTAMMTFPPLAHDSPYGHPVGPPGQLANGAPLPADDQQRSSEREAVGADSVNGDNRALPSATSATPSGEHARTGFTAVNT